MAIEAALSSESTREKFADVIDSALHDVVKFAQKHGKHESIEEVDKVARKIAIEIARLTAADRLIAEAPVEDRDGVAEKLAKPDFAQQEAQSKIKECLPQKYKDLMRGIAAGAAADEEDDDEPVLASQSVVEKDPLTTAPLQEEDGKFPLALQCSHVYNYSTVMGKQRNGQWVLSKCVAFGCVAKDAPIVNRNALKEDRAVKHNIIRMRNLAGTEGSPEDTMEIDDLE